MIKMYTDAHIHFVDLAGRDPDFPARYAAGPYLACVASHAEEEFEATERLRSQGLRFVSSFGIHPQWPVWLHADFLSRLAEEGRLVAIGEAGFDFFGDRPERTRSAENEKVQRAVFEYQLSLAERYGLPLLMHVRKASDLVFEYSRRLSRLPSVILHSYSGTVGEAEALLGKGVNAYFSFGSALMNGHKRAQAAAVALPSQRLLSETDAPWQPPRGSDFCRFEAIGDIVAALASLRGFDAAGLSAMLEANFYAAYPKARKMLEEPALASPAK